MVLYAAGHSNRTSQVWLDDQDMSYALHPPPFGMPRYSIGHSTGERQGLGHYRAKKQGLGLYQAKKQDIEITLPQEITLSGWVVHLTTISRTPMPARFLIYAHTFTRTFNFNRA